MNCPFDLKAYVLGESSPDEARRIGDHAAECGACRDEIARLQLTQATLLALRDEEMPRRIAFVSDRVFEPRWYQRLWNSAPQLGFLAAAMLACAILGHAFVVRPVAPPAAGVAQVDTRAIEQQVQARLNEAVETAVAKAVATSEARQRKQTADLIQAAEQRHELDRRAILAAFTLQTGMLQRQMGSIYVAANNMKAGE